ncbi:hypothetical protein Tco_0823310 [Tanacetum coccineum]|uniref:Integrase, catalytic region, zinc finger, CCHC-type, peptidase aspartic, catalytic n=1 Tax=Tanacetum coccineum TaxID=301880 RepID=A0ABQ5AIJ5_9ASTR
MSNMSEDIWYAGSDTRPPMLDRTDFESWQQRIRLYCLGKDNGENIMKSITEGPERARVFTDLSAEEKERYKADIRATNILLQAGIARGQNRDGNVNPGQAKPIMRTSHQCDDDVDDLALNVDHVFEADQCDAFDSDVDEAPTTQTMFMVNLSSEDPIYDEAGPSYDSNTPFEVQDHDTFVDHMDEYHEVHEMQNDVQHNSVVNLDADYTSDSNIIPYDQYVEDNEEHVVQSNVSSARNDALDSILDEMALTADKELVGVYEQRAKFELTDRERKIDEQMRIIISDRNRKETSLKSELHSAQLQLRSTLNHHKDKIAPPDYSKENLLATFAPQRNLTPEQIFWSIDNNDRKKLRPQFQNTFSIDSIKNLEHQIQEKDNVIRDLKVLVSNVNDRSCEPYNANDVTDLLEQNEHFRAEIEKVKQHYKELFESIKITRASTNEQTSSLLTQIEDLKAQLEGNLKVATRSSVKTKVLAPGMYAIDESVETVREIVEEARVVKPLDNALNYACQYTKLSQELLEYVIGTCPKSFNERDNKAPSTPVTRKKQVTLNDKPGTSSSNTQKHEVHQKVQQTNVPVIHSTGVSSSTRASGSKPRSNTKHNRILPAKSVNNKKVEDHQ